MSASWADMGPPAPGAGTTARLVVRRALVQEGVGSRLSSWSFGQPSAQPRRP